MSHQRIRRVSRAEAARLRARGVKVLSKACGLGCYFCTDCPDEPCCHGTVCKAPESARAKEVAKKVDKLITSGTVKIKVGPTGKVTFTGLPHNLTLHDQTPEAVLAQLKVHGSAAAKLAIMRAEQMGRTAVAVKR